MSYLIGYIITGMVIGVLARGFMIEKWHPSLVQTGLFGMLGGLLAGWLCVVVGWYGAGSGLGLFVAAFGAIGVEIFTYGIFSWNENNKNENKKLVRH